MTEIITIMQDAGGYLIWPVSLVLLVLILLQGGAGDISSAFGGGGQLDSSLGVGAQQKISKVTGWFVALFLAIVVILSIPPTGSSAVSDSLNELTSETLEEESAPEPENIQPDAEAQPAAQPDAEAQPEAAAPADGEAAAPEAEAQPEAAPAEAAQPADAANEAEVEVVE